MWCKKCGYALDGWGRNYTGKFGRGAMLLVIALSVGCSPINRLRFTPTESISKANADRVEPVYRARFGANSLPELLVGDTFPSINRVYLSSDHSLYMHRKRWTGLAGGLGWPVGIHEIDLRTGWERRRIRLPDNRDMTGTRRSSGASPGVFDYENNFVFWRTGFEGWGALVRLDLTKDDPKLLGGRGIRMVSDPFIEGNRLLVASENRRSFEVDEILYFDRATGTISSQYPLPTEELKRCQVHGGFGDFILVSSWDRKKPGGSWWVLKQTGGEIVKDRELVNEPGWHRVASVLDYAGRRWVFAEQWAGDPDDPSDTPVRSRIRAYSIPSLTVDAEFPVSGEVSWWGLSCVPRRSLAIVSPDDADEIIVLDLDRQTEILRRPLARHDSRSTAWWPVSDPEGVYFGAYDHHYVQLFAVRPEE
jgi:hypothetical protein